MGHSINHYTRKVTTKKDLQAFIDEITENAFDPQETKRTATMEILQYMK